MMMWRKPTGSGTFLDGMFGVAPRDRRDTTVGFTTLFLAMAGHAMMEAARDTLFLQGLPPTRLPWAYLAIAAVTLAGSAIQRRFLVGVSRRTALRWTLLVGAAASAAFALASSLHSSEAALLAFYTWTGLIATMIVVQFWLLAGSVMDFGQAKRAFALLGAGGLLGALVGSIGAAGVLLFATARALPLVAAGLFVMASLVPQHFSPERAPPRRPADPVPIRTEPSDRDRYLYRVFALVLLGTVTVTLVDYLFKSTVAREVPRERLGEFFSRYYAVINAAALGLELFVTPRLIRAAGVHRLVLVMPALLLVTSFGFATGGTLVAALLVRGADGSLRHSVNRVGVELLHLPLDGDLRAKMRTLSEAGGLRAGQALASLFVLTALGLGLRDGLLPWVPVVLSAVWLAATLRLEGAYVGRLRHQVEKPSVARPAQGAELDRVSERALTRALGASAEADVLAALDAIVAHDRPDLIPASILEHSSPNVVLRALEANLDFTRRVSSAVIGLLDHPNADVRVAALRRSIADGPQAELLTRSADDLSAAVRVTALVGLIRLGAMQDDPAEAELRGIVAGDDVLALRALARATGLLPAREWAWVARCIADGPDAPSAALVAEAIAEAPDVAHIPALIALLARREARSAARRALVTLGAPALDALAQSLENHRTPATIRIHLPRTISRFHDERAAGILQRAFMERPDDAVGFKVLRGLGRLRSDNPRVAIDRASLEGAALRTVERAVVASCWRRVVEIAREHVPEADDALAELLSKALAEETGRALERTFRVMHILEPGQAFQVMFAATRSDDPDVRARGREMIQYLAPLSLRRALLALLDEGPVSIRLQRPLGFRLPSDCLHALRLSRPHGTASLAFQREVVDALTACMAAAARHPNPLLRTLAVRYSATLARSRHGATHAG